jgi:hypothetical protein
LSPLPESGQDRPRAGIRILVLSLASKRQRGYCRASLCEFFSPSESPKQTFAGWPAKTPLGFLNPLVKLRTLQKMRQIQNRLQTLGFTAICAAGVLTGQFEAHAAANKALLQEDFPFQGACISAKWPGKNVAMKGLAIRVGNDASILFDTELMRMAAGWTGGYITTFGVAFDGGHGGHPAIDGDQLVGASAVPGWIGENEKFADPRSEPYGPLSRDWAHWGGLYLSGKDVALSYTIHGAQVMEQPGSVKNDDGAAFTRTFQMDAPKEDLTLLIADIEGGEGQVKDNIAQIKSGDKSILAGAKNLPENAKLAVEQNKIVLHLAKGVKPGVFEIVIGAGEPAKFASFLQGEPRMADFKKGGPQHWEQEVVTKGALNTSKTPDGAYVTDSLTPPLDNPWKRRVRFGGVDFFKDGKRAALSTWDGDVWIVSGIDQDLDKLVWKRFASGMYETLGLKIVNDVIYTSGRDQLTRYHDLNNDGEADFYENFNNDYTSSEGFHEFLFDLQTDPDGNFYFAKAGPVQPGGRGFERISANAGTLMKVSKDGSKLEVIATGFRAPNGIGVSPDGQLTTGDNEGTWVPSCPINWIKKGGFYGVENTAHSQLVPEFNKPLCWLSHNGWDNSGGGQAWVVSDKWGPFSGEMLHCSYGECALYLVMKQDLPSGEMQGGVTRFPLKFTSSAMRPKFNPVDGQLYVAGLQGWQTKAVRLSGLDRVRYTGKPVYMPRGLKVDKKGVHITFTQPLDEKDATDPQNYNVQQWNYERAEHYGSGEFSLKNPGKQGHDQVEIKAARLSSDKKTVTLELASLQPVMQMQIKMNVTAGDGTIIDTEIQNSIHEIP